MTSEVCRCNIPQRQPCGACGRPMGDARDARIAELEARVANLQAASDECERQDAEAETGGRIAGLRWVMRQDYVTDCQECAVGRAIPAEIARLEAELKR